MNLEYIHKSLRDKLEWDVECLALDLYDEPGFSSCTKLPTQHDLTNFLPAEINAYYKHGGGISTDERLWFPLELSDAPSICRVINDVSCFKGGYELVCGIKKKCKTHTRTTLRCQCGNRAKHSVGTKNATESTKPQDDKPICGVYINIFQDSGTGQYYIRKNGGHNLHHSGHPPVQKELKPAKRNKEMMNGDEAVTMNMDEALIKDGDSGKRSLGTHSKHGHNKRSNTTVGNALAMMADRKNQNAYSRIYPNFVEAADACTSEEDIQKLVDLLNEFRFATIGKNSRAVGRHLASQDLC